LLLVTHIACLILVAILPSKTYDCNNRDIAYNSLKGPLAGVFDVEGLASIEAQQNSLLTGTLPPNKLVKLTELRRL
jgi:hypothetical protein